MLTAMENYRHCNANFFTRFFQFKNPALIAAGNGLEFYDFMLYGLLAPVFAPLFFPSDNHTLSLLSAYALFAVGFVLRPLGVFIWGHIADKYGRKPVLLSTITLMAIPAIGISCLPTYESIGLTAPILLLIFRIIQGIAYSGECPTAIACLYEMSPGNKKVIYGSFLEIGAMSGIVTATFITAMSAFFMSSENFLAYGWRIPFFFSIIAIIFLKYVRTHLPETLQVNKHKNNKFPVFESIKKEWKLILLICIFMMPLSVSFYSYGVYIPNLLKRLLNLTYLEYIVFNGLSILYLLILIPIIASIVYKKNLKPLILFSFFGICSSNFISSFIVEKGSIIYPIFSMILIGLFIALLLSIHVAFVAGQSKKNNQRVSITGLGYNTSLAIFGGTSPMINEFLTNYFGSIFAQPFYLLLVCLIGAVAVIKMNNIGGVTVNG